MPPTEQPTCAICNGIGVAMLSEPRYCICHTGLVFGLVAGYSPEAVRSDFLVNPVVNFVTKRARRRRNAPTSQV